MGGLNPISSVEVDAHDFRGLVTNADPGDIPFGASIIQTNLVCVAKGLLQGRLGIRPGNFSNGTTPLVVQPAWSMTHYATPKADVLCYQTLDGYVRAGVGFA